MLTEQQKTLVETHLNFALTIAQSCLQNKDRAYDYAVDSLMVAAATYDPKKAKFSTYIANTLRFGRMSAEIKRQKEIAKEEPTDDEIFPQPPAPEKHPYDRVHEIFGALDNIQTVSKATKRLYKKIISLELEGLSLIEISRKLHVHRNTISRHHNRILHLLTRDNV